MRGVQREGENREAGLSLGNHGVAILHLGELRPKGLAACSEPPRTATAPCSHCPGPLVAVRTCSLGLDQGSRVKFQH